MAQRPVNDVATHSRLSRVCHWAVAILVFLTWPLGLMIGFVRDEVKLDFYLLHESFGFLVLWVMLLRVGSRLTTPSPPIAAPPFERILAHSVHGLLYLFLIVMPISGFLATNAHGFPLHWFGVVQVWSPIGKNPDIAPALSAVHEWSAWIVLALVALHLLAVVAHHVLRRDKTLYRML